ncbi:MAG: ROK family protein [Verrucomicrobiae bacterium]|nr:ROK family protein [Verrucomicrobiae bacterium]
MKNTPPLAGVEIGGTKIQVSVGSASGKVHETRRFAVERQHGAAGIQKQILDGLKQLQPFSSIGAAFGGPVDWNTGHIVKSHQISGWDRFDLAGYLEKEFHVPVRVENDANTAALAEAVCGAGRGHNPVFYMTVGSGIGGGLIVDGKIYHGASPGEAEIGNLRIPLPNHPPAQWPALEQLCAGWSIDARLRHAAETSPDGKLAELLKTHPQSSPEAACLLAARNLGDPQTLEIWRDLTLHLALGLSHAIHLFHPQILIIGGGISLLGQPLLDDIRRWTNDLVMDVFRGSYQISLPKLGEAVMPTGALLLAAQAIGLEK